MSTHFTRRGLLKGASAVGAASVLGRPYSRSRDAIPEDALSCHVLRLREGGLIKKAPNALDHTRHGLAALKRVEKGVESVMRSSSERSCGLSLL